MNNTPLPEAYCQTFLEHPACREIVQRIQPRNDPVLYCTFLDVLDVATAVCEKRQDANFDREYIIRLAQALACVASWRQSKQIYSFDPELARILIEQDLEGALPVETLMNLPYKNVFIETDLILGTKGFFVYFDRNEYTEDDLELRFCFVEDLKNNAIIPLHLVKGKTLEECLEITSEETLHMKAPSDARTILLQELSGAIQLILYLCAENKDVVEKKRLEFNKKKPAAKKKKKNKQTPKKPKIQEWKVGSVITKNFKRPDYAPVESHSGTGQGSSKSPHMRKAHWHHFWKGTGDTKRLVVKWIAPMFINKGDSKEVAMTINKVK